MKTIVVATDLSELSRAAVQQGANIASRVGAEIVLLHAGYVSEDHPEDYRQQPGHSEPWKRALQHELVDSRRRLEEIERELGGRGLRVSHRIVEGPPVEAICDAAKDSVASLVVMGSHGRTGYRRITLGSVAERVVRSCTASVLIARGGDLGSGGYRRIMVATDFDESAAIALDQACELAAPNAQVDIVHFWRMPPMTGDFHGQASSATVYAAVEKSLRESAEARGKQLLERERRDDVNMTFEAIGAPPVAGIQRALERQPGVYDLLAIGTHGRRGLKRWLLGSVAEATVRYSPCPVLVARPRT